MTVFATLALRRVVTVVKRDVCSKLLEAMPVLVRVRFVAVLDQPKVVFDGILKASSSALGHRGRTDV